MLSRAVIASASLLFCLAGAALAQDAPATCDTPQHVSERLIAASATQGYTVHLYEAVVTDSPNDVLAQLVAIYNDAPPQSSIEADLALVFEARNAGGMLDPRNLTIFFMLGCQVPKAGIMIPHSDIERILGPSV